MSRTHDGSPLPNISVEDLSTNDNNLSSPGATVSQQQDFSRLPSTKLVVTKAASFDQSRMTLAPANSPSAASLPSKMEAIGQLSVPSEVDLSPNEARPCNFPPPRRQSLAL